MNKTPQYFALFILSIVIASSLYLSWSTDRGLGELEVERFSIEREPGRTVNFMVYKPRTTTYDGPLPLVLTAHGVAGSKEGMYSFNIELARRNFTVVSVDSPGHGDSMLPFVLDDFENMALDLLAAVEYVQAWPDVNSTHYGVLTHSLGFQVAVEMQNFTNAPFAYTAVGGVADMGLGKITHLPGNLMIAMGELDEMISVEDALETIRAASGLEEIQPGVTYGSFENQSAYRVGTAPTDHVFEAIDGTIVAEACSWMVQALQGPNQLQHTRDLSDQIFGYKSFAMASGVFALLLSVLPLVMILNSVLPERIRPKPSPTKTKPESIKRSMIISAVLGTAVVLLFSASSSITYHLENLHIYWPNSMFATGLVLFFVFFTITAIVTLRVGLGKDQMLNAFHAAGIRFGEPKELVKDILRGALLAIIVIYWLVGWMALGGIPESMQPWIIFQMVRYPVGTRVTNIVILMIVAIPYYISETAWIRGILVDSREWGSNTFTKNIIFAAIGRLGVAAFWSVFIVSITTILGFIAGSMVLLGLLLMLFTIVSTLATILIAWTAQEIQNPWPAVFISAFIWAWVAISSIPLI
ncbi:MAG: alpha/beta hydrolase family protein [Candidatus Thorarchaeota archaeon]